MYLLDGRPSAPPTRAYAPELDWLRQLAERSYWKFLTANTEEMSYRYFKDLHGASRFTAFGGFAILGLDQYLTPTQELKIGAMSSAGRAEGTYFDGFGLLALMRGKMERVKSVRNPSLLGWSSLDKIARGVAESGVARSEPFVLLQDRISSLQFTVHNIRFNGNILITPEPRSIAGAKLDFRPHRRVRASQELEVVEVFQKEIKAQNFRNCLAQSYLDLPRAEPMALDIFTAIFEGLHGISPEIFSPSAADVWSDLTELLLERRPTVAFSKFKSYGATDRSAVNLSLTSCSCCGGALFPTAKDAAGNVHTFSEARTMLIAAHSATGCDGPSQVAEKTRTA